MGERPLSKNKARFTAEQSTRTEDYTDTFDGIPIPYTPRCCLYCGVLLQEAMVGYGSIENPTDGFYTPWCNKFHYEAYHQVGLWKMEDKPLPPAIDLINDN